MTREVVFGVGERVSRRLESVRMRDVVPIVWGPVGAGRVTGLRLGGLGESVKCESGEGRAVETWLVARRRIAEHLKSHCSCGRRYILIEYRTRDGF